MRTVFVIITIVFLSSCISLQIGASDGAENLTPDERKQINYYSGEIHAFQFQRINTNNLNEIIKNNTNSVFIVLARGCNNKMLDDIFKNSIYTENKHHVYFILLDYNLAYYNSLFSANYSKPVYILDGFYHGNTIAAKNKSLHAFFTDTTACNISGYIPYKHPQYYTLNSKGELINFYQAE
jgi:hypothetical protein